MRPESVGARLFQNIIDGGFTGPVFPVNPKYQKLNDSTCYPSIRVIDKPVDLAVIATPAATVSEIIHECGEHGVHAAIIVSAGFEDVPIETVAAADHPVNHLLHVRITQRFRSMGYTI